MSDREFVVREERVQDDKAISRLSSQTFGPGRFARTAYRVREGRRRDGPGRLDLCAWENGRLVGSIRFTEVSVGGTAQGLLLGPLVIDPEHSGRGCGRALIEEGLRRAHDGGHDFVILVGDLSYYGKFGFESVPPGTIQFPGPVDPARILMKVLSGDRLDPPKGTLRALKP